CLCALRIGQHSSAEASSRLVSGKIFHISSEIFYIIYVTSPGHLLIPIWYVMSQTLTTGSRLKDRYRIERELGRGGIGVVYLARDERLHGMPVVIKFLLDASGQNAWLTKKFMQEAEALTRINHPGVVRVIDRDAAEDGRPFFVMEFIEG